MGNAEPKSQLKYRFGEFTLDPARGTVRNGRSGSKAPPEGLRCAPLYSGKSRPAHRQGRTDSRAVVGCFRNRGLAGAVYGGVAPRLGRSGAGDRENRASPGVRIHGSGDDATRTARRATAGPARPAPAVQSEDDRLVVAQRVPGRYYLPLPRTPLIGRERELLTVRQSPALPGYRAGHIDRYRRMR